MKYAVAALIALLPPLLVGALWMAPSLAMLVFAMTATAAGLYLRDPVAPARPEAHSNR